MTNLDISEDAEAAEDIAAAGELEIQRAFDEGMARLTLISEGWAKFCRAALEERPTSSPELSVASGPATSQAA